MFIIMIMYSFMYYFSKLEHRHITKQSIKTQLKQTSTHVGTNTQSGGYINILHNGHMEADCTKLLANKVVFWSNMPQDSDLSATLPKPTSKSNPLSITQSLPFLGQLRVQNIFDWKYSYSGWFKTVSPRPHHDKSLGRCNVFSQSMASKKKSRQTMADSLQTANFNSLQKTGTLLMS